MFSVGFVSQTVSHFYEICVSEVKSEELLQTEILLLKKDQKASLIERIQIRFFVMLWQQLNTFFRAVYKYERL